MRPPREDYVRCSVDCNGFTCEPAVEHRDVDRFHLVVESLSGIAQAAYHALLDEEWRKPAGYRSLRLDPMAVAKAIGTGIANRWPDRAYFVEVWQDGREGFAQVFQPFGVPRNP